MLQDEQIWKKMDEVDIRQDGLALHSGVSAGTISAGLRGKGFSQEVFEKLDNTLNELIRIKLICEPLPLNFRDVRKITPLLERMRAGEPLIPPAAITP